jgi:hypothetical protein
MGKYTTRSLCCIVYRRCVKEKKYSKKRRRGAFTPFDKIKTTVEVQSDFSQRVIPVGTEGTVVECYENPEGYAVDLALPDEKLVGGFDYENVILQPNQFVVIK